MDIKLAHEVVGSGVVVVRTAGELDVYTGAKWRNYILDLMRGEEPPWHVGLDFSEITYFDSLAIGCLVRCYREHRDADGDGRGVFALFALQERTAKVMSLTGLERLITVVGSQEDFLTLVEKVNAGSPAEKS